MSEVTVREFSRNPSAFFALAEKGESMTITRHGKPIAMIVPASRVDPYARLVADGTLVLKPFTAGDIAKLPVYEIQGDGDPLEDLLRERAEGY